jgi:hypothetical protein
MATYDALKSEHQTLSGTTADEVKLTQFWPYIEIANRSSSVGLYISQTDSTPTSGEENTDYVAPNSSILVRSRIQGGAIPGDANNPCHRVYVVGSSNPYSVTGVQN